jgi:hypothetical protein
MHAAQDRIVRDSARYAWAAVSEWQSRVGVFLTGPSEKGGAGGSGAGTALAPSPSTPQARRRCGEICWARVMML